MPLEDILDFFTTDLPLDSYQCALGNTGSAGYAPAPKTIPMSLTPEQRIEREKKRREVANAKMREKVAAAREHGICRCGGKLDIRPSKNRIYSTCPECREKAKASATRYYREGPLPPHVRPPTKLDGRLRDEIGVRRRLERDGFGREAWWWFASAVIDGKQRVRRWSVDKHGDRGARRLAMEQRRDWEWEREKFG